MNKSAVIFATTCKGRTAHVKETLPRNLADNLGPLSRFLLLNYGSQDDLLDYLISNHKADMKSGKLILYTFATNGKFEIAHAKNMAHRLAILEGADILVTLDADNFTGPNFDEYIFNQFNCRSPIGADTGMFLYANINKLNRARFARGVAGRVVLRAQDFIKLGGYDERFDTWRGEDMDLNARLWRLGYGSKVIDPAYLDAIRHNDEVRFREYPHAKQYANDEELKIINRGTNTVVNFGKFGMGTVFRNFDPTPITLEPVPTRIFGIGLHKTATSSLHKAFQILGFDSFHWGTGEAPLIYNEMTGEGRSKTLERWYCLCDLPIPLLYRELDKAYPGSKFVLTVRDEAKWLKSVERLWDSKYNPTRWEWDIYPFSNRIHTLLYGQKDFDAEVMLNRYRRHNAEVREYFKSRACDLLVMNMSANAGWDELCEFLGLRRPVCPYPVEYATRQLQNTDTGLGLDAAKAVEQSQHADIPDEPTGAPDVLFPSADHVPVPKPPLGKIRILAPEECPDCGAPDWNSSLPDEPAECRFCRNVPVSNNFRPSLDPASFVVMRRVATAEPEIDKTLLQRLMAFFLHLFAIIAKIFRN